MKLTIVFLPFSIIGLCSSYETGVFKVGCNSFGSVVQSAAFVDKTQMIREFLDNEYTLVTAPRRFGKSINMDMIRRFCELQVNANATVVSKEKTENFKLFTANNFSISKNTKLIEKHFGKYLVIFLDFKELLVDTLDNFFISFRMLVRKVFMQFGYMLSVKNLCTEERNDFNSYYTKDNALKLSEIELIQSVKFLSQILNKHFNSKVIVLIDGFDSPIQSAILEPSLPVDRKIISFIRKFISNILKSNQCVEKALINACLQLSTVLLPDDTNIVQYPFLKNHRFNTFFGLTESEVISLAEKFNVNVKDVRIWYNGYTTESGNIRIYNVWSVIKYLQNRDFDSHWVKTGSIKSLVRFFFLKCFRAKVLRMLDCKTAEISYISPATWHQMDMLKNITATQILDKLEDVNCNLLLQFLAENGYFSIVNITTDNITGSKTARLTIPNHEMYLELSNNVFDELLFKRRYSLVAKHEEDFTRALLSLRNETTFKRLQRTLNKLFRKSLKLTPPSAPELAVCIQSILKGKTSLVQVNRDAPFLRRECSSDAIIADSGAEILMVRHNGMEITMNMKCQGSDLYPTESSAEIALQEILTHAHYNSFNHTRQPDWIHKGEVLIGVCVSTANRFSLCYLMNNRDISMKKCFH